MIDNRPEAEPTGETEMALFDVVIDVSDANGETAWPRVAASGVRVAMIKATQGATFRAHRWEANRAGAQAAGIRVVPYHFVTDADVAAQSAHFEAVAGLMPGMAYALDWEKCVLRDGTELTATAEQVETMGKILTAVLGRAPLDYWGIPGNTPEPTRPSMQDWERWVPRYRLGKIASFADMPASHQSPGAPFLFWQYTDGGRVDGIAGDVDRSVANFASVQDLLAWCAPRAVGPMVAAPRGGTRPA